jgi:hypothetical protein
MEIIDEDKINRLDNENYILNNIKNLTKYQLINIYDFLKKTDHIITENNNGIFFNLKLLSNEELLKLKEKIIIFLDYNKDIKDREDEREKEINKININKINNQVELDIINNQNNNDLNELKKIDNRKKGRIKEDYKMIGDKIVLKKIKTKYSGLRAKILKSYKDISQQNIVINIQDKKKNTIEEGDNEGEYEYIENDEDIDNYSNDELNDEDFDQENEEEDIDLELEENELIDENNILDITNEILNKDNINKEDIEDINEKNEKQNIINEQNIKKKIDMKQDEIKKIEKDIKNKKRNKIKN